MAKTIEQLKAQSAEVKNASVIGENTATRVGSLFNDIVEHVEAYEAGQAQKDTEQSISINEETARAQEAETTLSERINQEITDRKAMDETIGVQLSNEIERAKGMELGISTKLNGEIERATEAENDLQEKITSEADARDLAINAEAQARTQNDQLLSQAIAAEQERAEAAEEANATAIDAAVTKNEEQDQKLSELDGFEYDLSSDFVFSNGYVINAVPEQSNYGKYVNISSETLCATPNYIDISRFVGKTLELSFVNGTSTATTTWGLCFYDADKTPVSSKRFENTGVFEVITCSVVIPVNAVYIRTTFVQNSDFSAKITYNGKINEIQENIEPLLGSEKIIEITNPSVGKIINLSGQVSDLSAYNISEPILVNKGDVVKCSFGCEKNTSAICITELGDVTTRKHTLIQAGQGLSVAEYQYIADENCYIEFCYAKINGISNVNIKEASLKSDVESLEQDVETIKSDVESLEQDVETIKSDVESLEQDVETIKSENKLPYENLMVKMLCIGDSLTEGAEGDVDGIIGKNRIKTENYAYYIKLLTRLDIDVEGHSGRSASDFWNGCTVQKWDGSPEWFYGFKDNAEEHEYDFTPYDSFVIWLGTNNGLTDTLDTDVIPFTNYNDFANTETGCYCKIISKIISKVPHAKIFLGNVYASKGSVIETNATLGKIAQLYPDNVMGVVNNNDGTLWLQGSSFQTLYHNNNNNIHFNKVGEFILAEHWINGIRRLIKDNLIKFKNPILPVADRS